MIKNFIGVYIVCLMWPFISLSSGAQQETASFRASFNTPDSQSLKWSYLWNAPSGWGHEKTAVDWSGGPVGEPAWYRPLEQKAGTWFADVSQPAGSARLNSTGGKTGFAGIDERESLARYVIIACQVAEGGFYRIEKSFLKKTSSGSPPIDLIIHVDECDAILRRSCAEGQMIDFDAEIGRLSPGAIIYVAIGPGAAGKSAEFEIDFAVAREQCPTIAEQIEAAAARGDSSVRLRPGRYYQPGDETPELRGLQDFEIDATSVTLIARRPGIAMRFFDSRNVSLTGLTIDQDPLPWSQGEVTRVDNENRVIDVRVDDYYPYDNWQKADRGGFHNPRTGLLKHDGMMQMAKKIERLAGRALRLHLYGRTENIAVGDLFTASIRRAGQGFRMDRCENMLIKDLTLFASPSFGVYEVEGSGNVYENIAVIPGPKPLLATRERLRSAGHDGFHSRMARVGPKVLNSRFISCGDDGLAVNGFWGFAMEASASNRLLVAFFSDIHAPGDRLFIGRFADSSIHERAIENIEPTGWDRERIQKEAKERIPGFERKNIVQMVYLTYSGRPIQLSPKDVFMNRDRNGAGFEFRGNEIRNCNSRAMCIKADGVIDGNRMIHNINPAILVHSTVDQQRKESGFVRDLAITNNLIDDTGFWEVTPWMFRRTGGLVVTTETREWGAGWHRGIVIRDNVFQNIIRGPNIILTNASDVIMEGNVFRNTHALPDSGGTRLGVEPKSVIWMKQAQDIVVRDCVVENPGPHCDQENPLAKGESVGRVRGRLEIKDNRRSAP